MFLELVLILPIDTTISQIEFVKNNVEAWGVLMMAHLVVDKKMLFR